jgi:hypothetical protein
MSRLSTHLPRLATLAVAMAAAAASYCVHADRSASSGNEGRDQRAAPTADPGKGRSADAVDGPQRGHRSAERATADAEEPQAEHPAATSRSRVSSARPPSLRVYSAPSRPRRATSRRPHYAIRPRADRDAERDVDRELQRVIDAPPPTPAPAPPLPAPPSSAGGSLSPPDVAVPAADVDTTVPVPAIATPVTPTVPSAPAPQPPAGAESPPLHAGTDQVIPQGA